jgi:fructokinase
MGPRIVAFGELLWDLLPAGRTLGGAPFNFVYRVSSLGARGTMVSRLGRDDMGREAHRILLGLGMEDACIQWDAAHATGTVPITFDPNGIAQITIDPDVAYDYIEPAAEAAAAFESADCVCFGTLAQRAPGSRETLRALLGRIRGSLRVLDLNLRKDCWSPEVVRASIACSDVLKLNEEEATTVAGLYGWGGVDVGGIARRLVGLSGLRHVVVTLGGRGAVACSRDGALAYAPSYRVEVRDTLGSGDAFTAGFVLGLLGGWPLERCLRHGNAAGGLVAAQRGATEPFQADDLDRLVASGKTGAVDPRFA